MRPHPSGRSASQLEASGPPAITYLGLLAWLEVGYASALVLFAKLSWGAAAWQAALCVLGILPLLLLVLQVIAMPKRLGPLSQRAMRGLWAAASLAELLLPWSGWTVLLWFINRGALPGPVAWRAGAAIAIFSYATGLGLVLRFRTRARDVVLSPVDVPIPGLPESFDGYQILQLSDIHAGPFLSPADIGRRLAPASAVRPDLIAFTGDLAETLSVAEAAAEVFSHLSAPDGMWAVLGNHDIWVGEEQVRAALAKRGVRVLMNQHTSILRGGEPLFLAGVNDASYTGRDDLAAALAGIPEAATVILLSHAPAIVRNPLARRAALVLSGHTHGGQIVLPWAGPLYVPSRLGRRYASGLHQVGGRWLFITRGLGEIFPPIRVACPPEIAVITLRRAPL